MSGDADYASVSLLLHCDGADGSTTFTDNSPTPKTITVYGNAHIETDQSKFGGASGAFDGEGDYLYAPVHADFTFGSGDFTLELWVYPTALSGDRVLIEFRGGAGWVWFLGNGYSNLYTGEVQTPATTAVTLNAWNHVALSKSGTTTRSFINGVGSVNTASLGTYPDPTQLKIGLRNDGAAGFVGYLDDIRITKGVARYTANFTPPTEAFADSERQDPPVTPLALTVYPPYLPGQIETVMFGLQAFGLQSAPILAPTTGLALAAYPLLLDGVLLPAAIDFRHLALTPWVMPMTSPVYPPAVEVTLLPPPPGVSIRGLWSPADVLFGWGFNSGTDTISFPLASLFELTAAQADPVTGDWRAILLALVNSLWDAYIELDTPPQAMVLEYNPGYMMTVGPMVNTVRAEYNATTYLTFPDKFIADEP